MACDDFLGVDVKTQYFTGTGGNIFMTGAMKSVSAHFVFFIKHIRNGILINVFRHRLVKSRIENANLWHIGQQPLHCINAFKVWWVVKGCQLNIFFEGCYYFIRNGNATTKIFATMYHAMADSINFGK